MDLCTIHSKTILGGSEKQPSPVEKSTTTTLHYVMHDKSAHDLILPP